MVTEADTPNTAQRADAARVFVLGAGAWVVSIALPLINDGVGGTELLLGAVPLFVLVLGAIALLVHPMLAATLLMAVFPTLSAVAIAMVERNAEADAYPAPVAIVSSIGFLIFLATASQACTRPWQLAETSERPLEGDAINPDPRRRRLRFVVIAVAFLGALTVAVVAPSMGSAEQIVSRFGDSARGARVLAAIVAGALATVAMGGFVAPAMRRERRAKSRNTNARLAAYSVIAASGFVVWFLVR